MKKIMALMGLLLMDTSFAVNISEVTDQLIYNHEVTSVFKSTYRDIPAGDDFAEITNVFDLEYSNEYGAQMKRRMEIFLPLCKDKNEEKSRCIERESLGYLGA